MKIVDKTGTTKPPEITRNRSRFFFVFFCAFLWVITSSCTYLREPTMKQFYGAVKIPQKQEFRWSNGKLPKQLDPALAAAPPETDLVRAVYEGLTDLDAKTLEAKPAVAESWEVSPDGRTWTFHLRKDAKWTNGKAVTARDFARSWRRLAEMGISVPHSKLLKNIVGAENFAIDDGISVLPPEEFEEQTEKTGSENTQNETAPQPGKEIPGTSQTNGAEPVKPQSQSEPSKETPAKESQPKENPLKENPAEKKPNVQKWLGVEAVDDLTLRVWLVQPDPNFTAVAAHPVFRPVYEDPESHKATDLDAIEHAPKAVTNGAFHVSAVKKDELELERSNNFWGQESVGLTKVTFVVKPDAESALAAYQANEIDAITNTHFEPLALKLLTPFRDFKRTTHNALTFYQFNTEHKPFDDLRVRRALAMAIERERLVQDEIDGAAEPALDYLPFAESEKGKLKENAAEAKKLLAEAGFADIAAFPKIRLLVNRNDLQRRLANSVRKMWEKNLGLQTEIIIKDRAEYEEAIKSGDYDLARRGVVLPTADETSSLLAMFDPMPATGSAENASETGAAPGNSPETKALPESGPNAERGSELSEHGVQEDKQKEAIEKAARELAAGGEKPRSVIILTEVQAMEKLPAIPLYFPISYSLVKPYVLDFDPNLLDAPSLKTVRIKTDWKENSQSPK